MSAWKPGDDYNVRFRDKEEEPRTPEQLGEMVRRINEIANEYGFDVLGHGSWNVARRVALGEAEILKKYGVEAVTWRDRGSRLLRRVRGVSFRDAEPGSKAEP